MAWRTCWLALVSCGWLAYAQESDDDLVVHESLTVERRLADVRVIDAMGRPILGLTPEDFVLTYRGKRIPLLSCDWVDESRKTKTKEDGRLITIFFQVELNAPRVRGLKPKINRALEVIARLNKGDRVAVLSFDSHLKLWTDYTTDFNVVKTAIRSALRREKAPYPEPQNAPSLAQHLDQEAGKKARTPEKALAILARGLGKFDKGKTLIYLGFGPADFWYGNFQLREDYPEAKNALINNRVTVMSFDFAQMEYNTIDMAMRQLADDTGGFFLKSPTFITMAANKFENTMSGYYTISHETPVNFGPNSRFRLRLARKTGKGRGSILAKSPYNAWGHSR